MVVDPTLFSDNDLNIILSSSDNGEINLNIVVLHIYYKQLLKFKRTPTNFKKFKEYLNQAIRRIEIKKGLNKKGF